MKSYSKPNVSRKTAAGTGVIVVPESCRICPTESAPMSAAPADARAHSGLGTISGHLPIPVHIIRENQISRVGISEISRTRGGGSLWWRAPRECTDLLW